MKLTFASRCGNSSALELLKGIVLVICIRGRREAFANVLAHLVSEQ